MSQSFEFDGATYTWDGDLDEFTTLTPSAGEPVTLGSLIAMTNGAVLDSLPAGAVRSSGTEDEMDLPEAFAERGIVASAAVVAREGRVNRLLPPVRAVARALGDDGLGKSFDALVASGTVPKDALLATAVERSHEYYGVPALLASGDARRWVDDLSEEEIEDMLFSEAPEAFMAAAATEIVDGARQAMRERAYRG